MYKNSIAKTATGWRAWAFSPKAAQALNRRLRRYDADLELEGSEGVFDFADKDLAFVRATLQKLGGLESGADA